MRYYLKGGRVQDYFTTPVFSKSPRKDETVTKVTQLKREDIILTTSGKRNESK